MEPSPLAGASLAALRHLRGLSQEDCASAAGMSSEQVERVEKGEGTPEDCERIAALFGLSSTLSDDSVAPNDSSTFTVFLLHSATPRFDSADLRIFEQAMRAARIYTAESPDGQRTALRRRRFKALPPARPMTRDAAMQGHRLARQVRAALANHEAPLGDMRALLEDEFGIPVLVGWLRSADLRAAAALDADRACAAVVLSEDDDSRARNPRLARVYLAHELCHVLFDPSRPGRVQIALDDRLRGDSVGPNALLESRAKGFAAELLLPELGLRGLFAGEPPPATVSDAATWVRRAAEHFQAPREITIRHLDNLGFLPRTIADELLDGRRDLVGNTDSTTLPEPGSLPRCLATVPRAPDAWASTDLSSRHVPEFVLRARQTARAVMLAEIDRTLAEVLREASAGREIEATNLLVGYVDELLLGDELVQAREALERVDVEALPPGVTTTLAVLTAHAQGTIGATWERFVGRLMDALRSRWEFSAERCSKLAARLR